MRKLKDLIVIGLFEVWKNSEVSSLKIILSFFFKWKIWLSPFLRDGSEMKCEFRVNSQELQIIPKKIFEEVFKAELGIKQVSKPSCPQTHCFALFWFGKGS